MTTPTFSRIEIRHDTPDQLQDAVRELRVLASRLNEIATLDGKLMRLAAHDAIRETSQKTRGTA